VLEEMGEERFGGFLRGMLGIEGDEASLKNAWQQMWPTIDQAAQEILLFSTPLIAVSAIRTAEGSLVAGGVDAYAERIKRLKDTITPKTGVNLSFYGEGEAAPAQTDIAAETKEVVDTVLQGSNRPTGFMGRVASAVLRAAEAAVTGNLASFQTNSFDRAFAEETRIALGAATEATYKNTLAQAREDILHEMKASGVTTVSQVEADVKAREAEAEKRARAAAEVFVADQLARLRKTVLVNKQELPKGMTQAQAAEYMDKAVAEGRVTRIEDPRLGVSYMDNTAVAAMSAEYEQFVKDMRDAGLIREYQELGSGNSAEFSGVAVSLDDLEQAAETPSTPEHFRLMLRLGLGDPTDKTAVKRFRDTVAGWRNAYNLTQDAGTVYNGDTIVINGHEYRTKQTASGKFKLRPVTPGVPDFGESLFDAKAVLAKGKKKANIAVKFVVAPRVVGTAIELADEFEGYTGGYKATATPWKATYDAAQNDAERQEIVKKAEQVVREALNAHEFDSKGGVTRFAVSLGALSSAVTSDGQGTISVSLQGSKYHFFEDALETRAKQDNARNGRKPDELAAPVASFLDNLAKEADKLLNASRPEEKSKYTELAAKLRNRATRFELANKIFLHREGKWDRNPRLALGSLIRLLPELSTVEGYTEFVGHYTKLFGAKTLADVRPSITNQEYDPSAPGLFFTSHAPAYPPCLISRFR